MRLAAWLATAALVAGCANAAVGVGTGAVPGTSAASGVAAVNTTAGTTALGLVLILGTIDYVNNPQPFPDPSAIFMTIPPAPVLAPNRRITEQDCSKPIDLTQGNLRCK